MPEFIFIENRNRRIDGHPRVRFCASFLCQLKGLMFRSGISREEGLLLVGRHDSRLDSSIHMFFISFDLTVVWINSELQVVDKVLARPWRPAYFSKQPAQYALELHPERWGDFEIGDTVQFKNA
jgi:uncharacterized membrane protein (UPF0127 family)